MIVRLSQIRDCDNCRQKNVHHCITSTETFMNISLPFLFCSIKEENVSHIGDMHLTKCCSKRKNISSALNWHVFHVLFSNVCSGCNIKRIKGLFVEVMPSANNVAGARSYVIFATSFLQRHIDLQNHSHFPFRSKPQA